MHNTHIITSQKNNTRSEFPKCMSFKHIKYMWLQASVTSLCKFSIR